MREISLEMIANDNNFIVNKYWIDYMLARSQNLHYLHQYGDSNPILLLLTLTNVIIFQSLIFHLYEATYPVTPNQHPSSSSSI